MPSEVETVKNQGLRNAPARLRFSVRELLILTTIAAIVAAQPILGILLLLAAWVAFSGVFHTRCGFLRPTFC